MRISICQFWLQHFYVGVNDFLMKHDIYVYTSNKSYANASDIAFGFHLFVIYPRKATNCIILIIYLYTYSGSTNDECQTKNYSFKIIPIFIHCPLTSNIEVQWCGIVYTHAGIYIEKRVSHGQQTGYFNCLNMDGGFWTINVVVVAVTWINCLRI